MSLVMNFVFNTYISEENLRDNIHRCNYFLATEKNKKYKYIAWLYDY